MRASIRGNEWKQAAGKRRIHFLIAGLLAFVFVAVFLIPEKFIQAQSISILPGMKQSSGIVDKVVPQERNPKFLTQRVQERTSALSPRSKVSNEIATTSVSILNEAVTIKREEGLLQKSLTDVRSKFIPSQVPVAPRVKEIPKAVETNTIVIPQKLEVLSAALINQNIKGLAGLKLDQFMSDYLAAIGVELGAWMEDNGKEQYFLDLFKIKGPWVLVFLAMSPTSMHEYMQDLDLPSSVGDILEAKKLRVNMTIEQHGRDILVETQGAYDMWITFRINENNQVSVEKE
ncbi:MAG: hypothetical protein HZC17_04210 [Candidatus Omnitrophica bacterium]|nr:hypothetical protein [Candidatus Omnitrophota bacterium]